MQPKNVSPQILCYKNISTPHPPYAHPTSTMHAPYIHLTSTLHHPTSTSTLHRVELKSATKFPSSPCQASVSTQGTKRKLLLAEDGTLYKVKRSKLGNNVGRGQLSTVYLYYIVISFRNKLFYTSICV